MLTLFTTAKPFRGHIATIQRNALKSWTLLHPSIEIIVLGNDHGSAEVCEEFGLRHEAHVERNELGAIRLDSMFSRAQALAGHPLVCYVNCDIILTSDFRSGIERLLGWGSRFLMIGRRWDVNLSGPLDFSPGWGERLVRQARAEGVQGTYRSIDYFLFSNGLYSKIPPLVIGRLWWDQWLVWKARDSGATVVDASRAVCAVHQNHDYNHHPQGKEGIWAGDEARRNFDLAGGINHLRTIQDANFRLTDSGIRRNLFYWLAPSLRRWRPFERGVRGFLRRKVGDPMLDAARLTRRKERRVPEK
jgi:hypothetical protein